MERFSLFCLRCMVRLDGAILPVMEGIAHWVQRTFDRSCYWLAQQCALVFVLSEFSQIVRWWFPALGGTPWYLALISATVGVWWIQAAARFGEAGRRWRARPDVVPLEVLVYKLDIMAGMRATIALITLLMLGVAGGLFASLGWAKFLAALVSAVGIPALTCSIYFASVTPLPPGASRVRQLLESLQPKPAPAETQ